MNFKSCFRITMAAIAITGAMVLSSCSHEEFVYNEEKAEQNANEKYAIAFEKAFGKVGPNVDWGFSSKNTNTRAFTRADEVAFKTTITFPGKCDDSNFLDAVPKGVNKLPDEGGGANTPWFINGETQSVTTWNTGGTLYVVGNVDLSNSNFDINPDWQIYLVEGSTLKLSVNSAENLKGIYYIGKDATLETTGRLKLNSGAKVYTHGNGTLKVKDLEVNTNSVLYNSGTVKATGTVSAESNTRDGVSNLSFIVNNGTIECADVVVNAGAVQNIVDWTVSGTTHINSNYSGWINSGHWTTNNFAYVGGSENVINNCYLEVTNDFDMNVSSLSATGAQAFKINSGGSVETENFYGGRNLANGKVEGGPFRINMAEYSLFKVKNKATLESGRGPMSEGEVGFGFFGPSEGGYAVFEAKEIARDKTLAEQKNHGAVTYGDNLYVYAETHFAQGYDSDGSGTYDPRPFIYEQGKFSIANNIYASGFKPGKPSITIKKTECCPGFEGGDPLFRVIAEDLSADQAGDFDFNDVVFDVVKYENGKTTLRLQACGGTLPLRIGSTKGEGGVEVHSLYGEKTPDASTGLYHMWNTSPSLSKHDPVDFEIDGQYTTPEQLLNLRIEVLKEGAWMLLGATKGVAACKILVDDRFPIVPERTGIADKFGNFTTYVQGEWNEDDNFWWLQQ